MHKTSILASSTVIQDEEVNQIQPDTTIFGENTIHESPTTKPKGRKSPRLVHPQSPENDYDRADTIQLSSLKDPRGILDPIRTVELSRAENSQIGTPRNQQIHLYESKDMVGDSQSNLPYDSRV